jgi:hypothetical protein
VPSSGQDDDFHQARAARPKVFLDTCPTIAMIAPFSSSRRRRANRVHRRDHALRPASAKPLVLFPGNDRPDILWFLAFAGRSACDMLIYPDTAFEKAYDFPMSAQFLVAGRDNGEGMFYLQSLPGNDFE